MDYDFSPNANLTMETHHIGRERQPLLVIDDYLRDPESLLF